MLKNLIIKITIIINGLFTLVKMKKFTSTLSVLELVESLPSGTYKIARNITLTIENQDVNSITYNHYEEEKKFKIVYDKNDSFTIQSNLTQFDRAEETIINAANKLSFLITSK